MAPSISTFSSVFLVLLALYLNLSHHHVTKFCQAEYFLYGATGQGLDSYAPGLSGGGPPPIGAQKAMLLDDPDVARTSEEIAYQQIGNIRSIVQNGGGIPRPLLNLGLVNWGLFFDLALKTPLIPPFNPYANSLNFLLGAYAMPDLAQISYVSSIPSLTTNSSSLSLAAKLLAIKAGQSAVLRALLYPKATQLVPPYNFTVREFTKAISQLTNDLGKCGIKSEGILLANTTLGAENRTTSNVLSADANSLSYARTEPEILRIVYGAGNEHLPGGFFPLGANGKIARSYLLI
uniref:desiccation-related protein PCC13-62-like n=1 Tax=Fragaria vesca subsp. vesca TaxID=101020 RepID=UPI0005CA5565|nr:PREDICTED: desiccation-related protein PCC13-62-like [Fragaria vesca subsp. vesca]